MTAPLPAVLERAARLYGTTPADIRLGFDDRALAGLGAFGWLARRCTRATDGEIALHAGRPLSLMLDMVAQLDEQLVAQPPLAEALAAEVPAALASAAMVRRRDRLVEDVTPEVTARRLIQPGPAALTVGQAQLRALAAAYLSLSHTKDHAHV